MSDFFFGGLCENSEAEGRTDPNLKLDIFQIMPQFCESIHSKTRIEVSETDIILVLAKHKLSRKLAQVAYL